MEFDEYSYELDYHFITGEGVEMKREEFCKKMNDFFQSFERFQNDGYKITLIDVAGLENGIAMGFSEGMYKYDAVLENGELLYF